MHGLGECKPLTIQKLSIEPHFKGSELTHISTYLPPLFIFCVSEPHIDLIINIFLCRFRISPVIQLKIAYSFRENGHKQRSKRGSNVKIEFHFRNHSGFYNQAFILDKCFILFSKFGLLFL